MRDLLARLAGVLLLLGSLGSTLAHREVWEAARHGSAQPAEFALGLLTFCLASTGLLLLLHGKKLFDRSAASNRLLPAERERRDLIVKALLESGSPEAVLLDTRRGVALVLAYRALADAATRARPRGNLASQAEAAYRRNLTRG